MYWIGILYPDHTSQTTAFVFDFKVKKGLHSWFFIARNSCIFVKSKKNKHTIFKIVNKSYLVLYSFTVCNISCFNLFKMALF